MELLEIMQNRRSVRKYTGEAVPQEAVDMILQAGLLSPTGKNIKPYEFIVVRDKGLLKGISESRPMGSQLVAGADVCIVVIAKTELTNVWVEDCSSAISYMHLMADSLGIGSCWIQCRNRENQNGGTANEHIKELLGIPEGYEVAFSLALGMPAAKNPRTELEDLLYDKIHTEKF